MSKSFGEHHLITLLRTFNTDLALNYLGKVKELIQVVEEENISRNIDSIEDRVLIDPTGFRIRLSGPTYLMFSPSIGRVRNKIKYTKEIEWEKFLVMNLGMIPVYLVNLNVITMLKLWGENSYLATSELFSQEMNKGSLVLELSPSETLPEYSSMNFLLLYGASKYMTSNNLFLLFQKYYRYSFWSGFKKGYTTSSHFFHRRNSITTFVKVMKGLYRINSLGNRKWINIEGRRIDCVAAELSNYVIEGTIVSEVRIVNVYLPNDIVENLKETKDIDRILLNVMIIEVQSEESSFNLLTDVVDISESSLDLISTLIGLHFHSLYLQTVRPCYVSTKDELLNGTRNLFNNLLRFTNLPYTIADCVDKYDLAIRELYPLLIFEQDKVFFMHPMLIAFLAEMNQTQLIENNAALASILNLFETAHSGKRRMQLYLNPTMKYFQDNKNKTVSKIISYERKIRLSKYMYKIFDNL